MGGSPHRIWRVEAYAPETKRETHREKERGKLDSCFASLSLGGVDEFDFRFQFLHVRILTEAA